MPRKVQIGIDDLKTLYSELIIDWDYEQNKKLPEEYLPSSNIKVHWKCHVCGYKWETQIACRAIRNYGCPSCSGRVVTIGKNDLPSRYPDIAKEWNYELNGNAKPEDYSYASQKKIWWTCPVKHNYEQSINKRTLRGFKCPICSGHKTISGVNDFATIYPEIAKEWHPTKNGSITPDTLSSKNGYRAWWKCKYGHEWQQTLHVRSTGTGCPYCKNRYSTSFAEQAIFFYIKKLCPDAQNRYKDLFDNNMEFDVYIPSRKTAIEFDGAYWHDTEDVHEKEKYKYEICQQHEIRLIRVKEETKNDWRDVADITYIIKKKDMWSLQGVIQEILNDLDPESNKWTRKNPLKFYSSVVANVENDRAEILRYLKEIPNSIILLRPDLVDEWNYDKNDGLTPELFGINSNEKVWWRCKKCSHEWKTSIIQRAGKRRSGCPDCSKLQKGNTFTKNRIKERGSLAENCPELLKQWDYSKNTIKPTEITSKYNKKVWWKCTICNYSWETSPNNRSKGSGCPCCSGRVARIGINDLKTVNPCLVEEWDYTKNKKKPEEYMPNSHYKVWWICRNCGHEWEAAIGSRNKGHGCPKCSKKKQNEKGII